jgi:hypothetical protein
MRKVALAFACIGGATVMVALVIGVAIRLEFPDSPLFHDTPNDDCNGQPLTDPPSEELFGSPAEICARGDEANPGEFYARSFPSDDETQERRVGGRPARFSGYTTSIDSVELVPADRFVDGYSGVYVRIEFTVFNRDAGNQSTEPADFAVWRADEGFRLADFVGASDEFSELVNLPSGATQTGALYLYIGEPRGDVFVRFDPDSNHSDANQSVGVWQVLDDGRVVAATTSR